MDASWLLDPGQDEPTGTAALAWFLVIGPILGMMGWLGLWAVHVSRQPLPRAMGVGVLVICIAGTLMWPLSGFLVGILLGLFMIFVRPDRA